MLSDRPRTTALTVMYTDADRCCIEVTSGDRGVIVAMTDEDMESIAVEFSSREDFHRFINACSMAIRSC